jgi:hypothetical protein
MRFRAGIAVGLATGYVLGTKAGRERYEQIKRWWRSVSGSPQVHQLTEKSKELAGQAGRKGVGAVQRGVSKVGSNVKSRLGNGHAPDVSTPAVGI